MAIIKIKIFDKAYFEKAYFEVGKEIAYHVRWNNLIKRGFDYRIYEYLNKLLSKEYMNETLLKILEALSDEQLKERQQMILTDTDLTHEIEKSSAVQISEHWDSHSLKVTCPHCGFEMPVITVKSNAVCRGLEMRCKNQACKQLFEIKINTDKIK